MIHVFFRSRAMKGSGERGVHAAFPAPGAPFTSAAGRKKKPTWPNALRHSTTSAYSSTGPPARPGCPSSSRPTKTPALAGAGFWPITTPPPPSLYDSGRAKQVARRPRPDLMAGSPPAPACAATSWRSASRAPQGSSLLSLNTVIAPPVFGLGPVEVEGVPARLVARLGVGNRAGHPLSIEGQYEATVGARLKPRLNEKLLPRAQQDEQGDFRSSGRVQPVPGQAFGFCRHLLRLTHGRSRLHKKAAQSPGYGHVLPGANDQEVHRSRVPIAGEGRNGGPVDGVDLPCRQGRPEASSTGDVHVKRDGSRLVWHQVSHPCRQRGEKGRNRVRPVLRLGLRHCSAAFSLGGCRAVCVSRCGPI